jgi:hypothetical protein
MVRRSTTTRAAMNSHVRRRALAATAVCAVVCMLATAAFAGPAGAASFRTVDVPDASGTDVGGVNNAGTLVGVFRDSSGTIHSFIEQRGGQPTVIDDPAAVFTGVIGINDEGTAVGEVYSPTFGVEGFIRSRNGSFTTLADPSPNDYGFTQVYGINDSGLLVGIYQDAAGTFHGFVDDHGKFTTLDYPGAGTGFNQGTVVDGVNNSGVIVGSYIGADNLQHGFLYRNGTFTEIPDAPNAGTNPAGFCGGFDYGNAEGTIPGGISASGVISVGVCNDVGQYGWVLSNGQFSPLNDPDTGQGLSYPSGISENGRFVSGTYVVPPDAEHGFVATLTP